MSEQPRSVPPQDLAASLGRRRRSRRSLPAPTAPLSTTPADGDLEVATASAGAGPAGGVGEELQESAAVATLVDVPDTAVPDTAVPAPAGVESASSADVAGETGTTRDAAAAATGTSAPATAGEGGAASKGAGQLVDTAAAPATVSAEPAPRTAANADDAEGDVEAAGEDVEEEPAADAAEGDAAEAGEGLDMTSRRSAQASTRGTRGRRRTKTPAKIGRPKSVSAATPTSDDHKRTSTGVYVPLDVHELVLAQRRTPAAPTSAEVALRAIENQFKNLPDLVKKAAEPQQGAIFTFTAPAGRSEPKVQMALRLTKGQLKALDWVEQQVGATSRGQLVTLAVRAEHGA